MNSIENSLNLTPIIFHVIFEKFEHRFLLKRIQYDLFTSHPNGLPPRIIITKRIMTEILPLTESLDNITTYLEVNSSSFDHVKLVRNIVLTVDVKTT